MNNRLASLLPAVGAPRLGGAVAFETDYAEMVVKIALGYPYHLLGLRLLQLIERVRQILGQFFACDILNEVFDYLILPRPVLDCLISAMN